jgi:hypothetical protein
MNCDQDCWCPFKNSLSQGMSRNDRASGKGAVRFRAILVRVEMLLVKGRQRIQSNQL